MASVVGMVLGLAVVASMHEGAKPESLESQHTRAITACREFVTRELKAPATAKFPRDREMAVSGTNPFTVASSVDSQNSFGALIRSSFVCTVSRLPSGDWRADDVRLT